jgi:putative ABC transport system permease protein
MENLLKDIRFGLRGLLKQPGFSLLVVATLALGIGSSTAIFSVVNSVLLNKLPYRDASRIVAIQELDPKGSRGQVTSANFLDWRKQNTVFEHLAAIRNDAVNLALADRALRLNMAATSANFFEVFGVGPQLGRLFVPADEEAGHPPVVVISYNLWQGQFGGQADVIGKNLVLDGSTYSVIGVAPPGFQYPDKTELWLPPLRLVPELFRGQDVTQTRGMGYLSSVALLKPGVSVQQAAAEMETITARLRQQYPDTNNKRFNRVVSLQDHLIGDNSKLLWLLLGAVTFVLLIACANVANLLLATGASRQKEMAIRSALGASRWRVVRQLLTESTLMALVGGLFGLLIAFWGVALITRLLPTNFPRLQEIHIDLRVLAFTFAASVLTGILFGLAPSFQFLRGDVQESMKETSRGASAGPGRSRLRQVLIVSEVALCVVLLAGAGLLFRSFLHLQAVNTGFTAEHVLTAKLAPSGMNYPDAYFAFYDKALDQIQTIPGVQAVGSINTLPLSKGPTLAFRVEGREVTTPDKWPPANYRNISPDYFRAMNIPVVEGRPFSKNDKVGMPLVVMVNQALAHRDFPGENPVGKRVNFGRTENGKPVWFEIVGLASDVRSMELKDEPTPEVYFSSYQDSFPSMSLVIRTSVEPESISGSLRQVINQIDKSVPVTDIRAMDVVVSESITQPRFNLFLLALFGGLALLLSAAGIYGVTAYTVSQRTHELGIRIALGAQVGDVLRMILRQGLTVILIGMVIGLAAAFALLRVMRSLLFGVSASDPVTFVVITAVLLFVALLACYIPARRATKVDPLVALRYE